MSSNEFTTEVPQGFGIKFFHTCVDIRGPEAEPVRTVRSTVSTNNVQKSNPRKCQYYFNYQVNLFS
jgi:hypothetical protein